MACARGCDCDACFALGIGAPAPGTPVGIGCPPPFSVGGGGSGGAGQEGGGITIPGDWRDCYPDLAAALVNDGNTAFDASGSAAPEHGFVPEPSSTACRAYKDDVREPKSGRILLAISGDGVTWKKTGQVIVNHGSVPCLAVEGGVLYLFCCVTRPREFNGRWGVDDADDAYGASDENKARPTPLAVAYTSDLVHWVYRLIGDEGKGFKYEKFNDTINDDPYRMSANDPSVVQADTRYTEESTDNWLLYYALHYSRGEDGGADLDPAGILVAAAERLSDFEWETRRASNPNGRIVFPNPKDDPTLDGKARAEDPSVVQNLASSDGYRMFAGGNASEYNWRVKVGDDGEVVPPDSWDEFQETCDDGGTLLMNNGLAPEHVGEDLTWYASVIPSGERQAQSIIRVTVDADGNITVGDCRVLLEEDRPYEHEGIHEAAVAKFRGCWVMAYTTSIPLSPVSVPGLGGPDGGPLMAGYPSTTLPFP
jgi:hypothetical protein